MAPARSSRCSWRERFGYVCSAFGYACCEPCAKDLYDDEDEEEEEEPSSDGHSDLFNDDAIHHANGEHQGVAPRPIFSFESSQAVARAVAADKRQADRQRLAKPQRKGGQQESRSSTRHEEEEEEEEQGEHVYDDFVDSPATDATRTTSLTIEDFSVANEEKTPISDAGKGQSSLGGGRPRDRLSGTPPRHPANQSRWSDEILEGFLFSTLVDGSGLVLDKLDSDGKGKKCGERILSYDPEAMRLHWISTGMRRKPGSMLAKDIDEVLCEGTSVTIVYSQSTAMSGTLRRMSMSPMRRSSHSSQQTAQGRRRKVFQTSQERDALILTELLLFVRRKALVAFSVAVSKLAASAHASNGSSGSSAVGFDGVDSHSENDSDDGGGGGGGGDSAVTKSRSFGSGGVKLGGSGGFGRSRRRSVL